MSIHDIHARLEGIADELADLAMVELREALERGATASPAEKRLTRARRAVEKAAHLLDDAAPDLG